jgi:hypothetical protein
MSNISSVFELEALSGLAAAKRTLKGIVERGSPVHAVLLYGVEGSGKTTLASFLASYWLCSASLPTGACGECRACRALAKGSCADLHVVTPRGPSSLIRLPAIYPNGVEVEGEVLLSVQEFLRTMPVQGRTKVVMIESADRMNGDASRALLKTLEEPQSYARFVLTTKEISRVEATIRSRCMAIPCELPMEGLEVEPWLHAISRGSPGLAQRLARSADIYRDLYELAKDVARLPRSGALSLSERFRKIVERLQKAEETNARGAGAAALQSLGTALAANGFTPISIQRLAESHRRILGNANAPVEFDALFSAIMSQNR